MTKLSFTQFLLFFATLSVLTLKAAPYDLAESDRGIKQFAPDVVTTRAFEINAVFNREGDKVMFSRCNDAFDFCQMMESDFRDGQWQQAETLPFSGAYFEGDPYYSADYSTVYFISRRPVDGGSNATESFNLWFAKRSENGWQEPVLLERLSSDNHDLYPSLTDDGSLFFLSFRDNGRHLYQAQVSNNGFSEPVQMPAHIYGKDGLVGDSMVTRDGKHIIFSISGREDSKGRGDLYISHLIDGNWSVASSLGDLVNTADHEFTPILSPDNRYLFFTRVENGVGNLYQIALAELGINL